MKISCGVIRDLLPLYTEKMTGEESDALVRGHLSECKDCAEYLEKLQNPLDGEIKETSSGENSLKMVAKRIKSRKITAVIFSALIVFTVMLTAFSRIIKPDYISYGDSGVSVSETADGDVYVGFSDKVTSCKLIKSTGDDNKSVVEIEAWTCLWDKLFDKTTPHVLISSKADKTDIAYFCDLSTEDDNVTLIYGEDAERNISVLPRLVLGYYFAAALAASAVIGLAYLIFKKNEKARRLLGYLFVAPVSYMLAHLVITTGFVSFSATYDFILNCAAALAIYGIIIFGASVYRSHKSDMAW